VIVVNVWCSLFCRFIKMTQRVLSFDDISEVSGEHVGFDADEERSVDSKSLLSEASKFFDDASVNESVGNHRKLLNIDLQSRFMTPEKSEKSEGAMPSPIKKKRARQVVDEKKRARRKLSLQSEEVIEDTQPLVDEPEVAGANAGDDGGVPGTLYKYLRPMGGIVGKYPGFPRYLIYEGPNTKYCPEHFEIKRDGDWWLVCDDCTDAFLPVDFYFGRHACIR